MPDKSHSPGCPIDSHPHAVEIAGWLRQNMTSTAVNAKLRDLADDPVNFKPLPASTISYHRRLCLGMAKLSRGRPFADGTRAEDVVAKDETDADILAETKTLALGLFRHRLKTQPDKVGMKDLTPVLTAILRLEGKGDARNPLDAAMGDVTSDSGEAAE